MNKFFAYLNASICIPALAINLYLYGFEGGHGTAFMFSASVAWLLYAWSTNE